MSQGTPPEGIKPRKADYPRCGAKKKTGGTCGKPAGWGTPRKTGTCSAHLGNSRNHVKHAQAEIARQACTRLGLPIEMDPGEALLSEVFETLGNREFYRLLVAELPTHPDPDEYIPPDEGGGDGYWIRGEAGVYGRTYHVSGVPTGEAKPHVLVQLYNAERKHLVDVSTAALRAGVEQRALDLASDTAQRVVQGMMAFARAMGLDPGAQEVRAAAGEALRLVAGGDNGG